MVTLTDEEEETGYINNLEVFAEWFPWYLEEWEEKNQKNRFNKCKCMVIHTGYKNRVFMLSNGKRVSSSVVLWKN